MPFDNYVAGAICSELNSALSGGRIERLYQPEREEIIMCINRPPSSGRASGRYNLLISSKANKPAVYLTETREISPGDPPAFCMLLRKYLIGARIESFEQIPKERIIRMNVLTSGELGLNDPRTLVFELMGKHSNIIFLNGTKIADAIKRIPGDISRARQILPGMEYILPPPGKGISPLMEEETRDSDLTGKGPAYYDRLAEEKKYTPLIISDGEKEIDFYVFRLGVYEGMKSQEFSGETAVSEMLEAWYENREASGRLLLRRNELMSAIRTRLSKLLLKKQRLSEELMEAERADTLKQTGDLITSNLWRIEKGAKRVFLEDFLNEGDVRTIDLDPRLSPAGNAQRFYKLYNKARTALVVKKKQLDETQKTIDYLEGVKHFVDSAVSVAELEEIRGELAEAGYLTSQKEKIRKKKTGKKMLSGRRFAPHKYTLDSGATLLVGRNNSENDELTLRVADKSDYWMHTKNIPGSHVILKPAGAAPAEADLRSAAEAAAWYSKARYSEGVPVDYTPVRYVKKPSGARPGYVIFTNNRTLYVTPKLPDVNVKGGVGNE